MPSGTCSERAVRQQLPRGWIELAGEQAHLGRGSAMRGVCCGLSLLFPFLLWSTAGGQNTRATPDERYSVAFASLAPVNTDLFIADGSDARPFAGIVQARPPSRRC
jgi:hypothetical protein